MLWKSLRYDEHELHTDRVQAGTILWLPAVDELLARSSPANRRARTHSIRTQAPNLNDLVEDGLLGHPILVVSRPTTDRHIVHFCLVRKIFPVYPDPNADSVLR